MSGLMKGVNTFIDKSMDASSFWPQGGIVPQGAWSNPYYRPNAGLFFVDAFMRGMQGAKGMKDAKDERDYRRKMEQAQLNLQRGAAERADAAQQFQQQQYASGKMQEQANKRAMLGLLDPGKSLEFGGRGNRDISRLNALPDVSTMGKMHEMQKPKRPGGQVGQWLAYMNETGESLPFEQFVRMGSAPSTSVTVNTGDEPDARPLVNKPEKGFQRVWDDNKKTWRDEPIPGSKPASEKETRAKTGGKAGAIAVREIDFALDLMGADKESGNLVKESQVAGPRGRVLSGTQLGEFVTAGTRTGDFVGTLQSIKDTIAIERLLEIKASGAGLGQVPQSQLDALARALGYLNPNASDKLLARNLADVRRIYANVVESSMEDANDKTFSHILGSIVKKSDDVDFVYNPETREFE